jgi:hypothetical protein
MQRFEPLATRPRDLWELQFVFAPFISKLWPAPQMEMRCLVWSCYQKERRARQTHPATETRGQ